MTSLKALGGTSDILPDQARRWQRLEESARRLMDLYGYEEIRTPLIEEASVFTRSLGDAAEIVTKQMYLFEDRGGRRVALRPEGTASVVRAFVEHGLDKTAGLARFYYVGPMFRAERPQAGRRRQFHQLGVEVFGSMSPYQDAEVVELLMHLLEKWGIQGAVLRLNNLGCQQDRPKMLEELKKYFAQDYNNLCPDCQQRLKVNPLRILDCKEEKCRLVSQGSMASSKWLCPSCQEHFQQVMKVLDALGIDCEWDQYLVRGLDYYTKTAFEVIHPGLGAQNALGGGGRYDDLVEALGGLPTPAVGFAVGLERILMALEEKEAGSSELSPRPSVFVAPIGEASLSEGLKLLGALRAAGIPGVMDYEARPLKRQLEQANKLGCRVVLMLGDVERDKKIVLLKDMASGAQIEAPQDVWLETLQKILKPVS